MFSQILYNMGVNITGIGIANGIGFKSYYKFNNPINPDYDAILLESSSYILLEDGDFILLENAIDPKQ